VRFNAHTLGSCSRDQELAVSGKPVSFYFLRIQISSTSQLGDIPGKLLRGLSAGDLPSLPAWSPVLFPVLGRLLIFSIIHGELSCVNNLGRKPYLPILSFLIGKRGEEWISFGIVTLKFLD
jgi:hypothetical protein